MWHIIGRVNLPQSLRRLDQVPTTHTSPKWRPTKVDHLPIFTCHNFGQGWLTLPFKIRCPSKMVLQLIYISFSCSRTGVVRFVIVSPFWLKPLSIHSISCIFFTFRMPWKTDITCPFTVLSGCFYHTFVWKLNSISYAYYVIDFNLNF